MIRRALILLVTLALLGAACGDDDDAASSPSTEPSRADAPQRIVSLSPTGTEVLFAVGAGDQVVAVDDQSNYPADAPKTDLSGFQPNLEAISKFEPDLVVISGDPGDLTSGLGRLGVEVLLQPAVNTLDEAYAQIRELGEATGHGDEAEKVVARMRAEIKEIVDSAPASSVDGMTYYHELDDTYFSVTSSTFIGTVYGLLGLRSVADPADKDGSGYPQLSAEFLLQADPDLIFLADTKCCGQNAATVAERPGWSGLKAVQNGAVIELDDDIASRWGPRIVDLLRSVVERLEQLELKPAA